MTIRLILDPYDSGHRDRRMGRGPMVLARNGLADRLAQVGTPVETTMVEFDTEFPIEMATTFGLLAEIARQVQAARSAGEFPLVVSGSCNCTTGALTGFDLDRLALVWFDAHGDFHTPETTSSGFMGGLPLSIALGHCWQTMAASIPGYTPLSEDRVVMVGLRDVDPPEAARFAEFDMTTLSDSDILDQGVEEALGRALQPLAEKIDGIYLHLDLDVCDPAVAPVNPYQTPGGLSLETVEASMQVLASRHPIVGASVTAYDPGCDPTGKGMQAAFELLETLVSLVGKED